MPQTLGEKIANLKQRGEMSILERAMSPLKIQYLCDKWKQNRTTSHYPDLDAEMHSYFERWIQGAYFWSNDALVSEEFLFLLDILRASRPKGT